MRIKNVFVRNFRKFLQPVTLSQLSSGICVIAGDNEEGKSTIVHAIRSAFHLKYSTTATQQIQPYNSSVMPEVAIDFDLNGTTYQLKKTFGKKGSAELRTNSSVFSGSEAEEKLQELCNLGADKKESSIWNVLWVEQGTTFGELKVGESGKRTLQAALENELGSIVGGEAGQNLFRSIKELHQKWFTPTGKDAKNSEHKQYEEQLSEVQLQLEAATTELEQLQTMLDELDSVRSKIKSLEDNRTIELAQTSLTALLQKKGEIDKQLQEFKQAEQVERAEQAQQLAAQSAWKQRNAAAQECEASAIRTKAIADKIAAASEHHKRASEQLHGYQQKRTELESAYEQALSQCESVEKLEQLGQLQSQIKELEDSLAKASAAEQQCQVIRKQGEAVKIERETLESLRLNERQLLQCEAQLTAAATKLEVRPTAGNTASIAGAVVDENNALLITERTSIALSGWGEIIVSPGAGGLEKLTAASEKLRASLSAALNKIGVATVEEAEERERVRAELALEYKSAARDVQKYAPAGTAALQDQLTILKGKLEELQAAASVQGGQELEQPAQLALFSITDSADRLSKSRANRDAAKQTLAQSKAGSDQCEAQFREADRQLQTLSTQQTAAQEELSRLNLRLETDRQSLPDEGLFHATKESEMRLQTASKLRDELQTKLKSLNADRIDTEIQSAEQTIQQLVQEHQTLRESQSRLEGSLQTLGRTGLPEEVEKLRGKREQLEKQFLRSSRKAKAIKLLHDTLLNAETNSKQQLAEPLMKRLSPYMAELFSDSKFALEDGSFSIAHLERQNPEPFQNLSLGTREQITVLTRLAFAEILCDAGAPAVVILDDALVYSDETRFERMQEVLKRAGEKFQIIIMTCRERDYHNMGVPIIRLSQCVGSAGLTTALEDRLLSNRI